jgi:UDP-2,3-diacylglucosamine pyrophosphatase LpxH
MLNGLTHYCPSYKCVNSKYNVKSRDYFASDQEHLIRMNNVLGWIHGHTHYNKDINIHGKLILSNQYGSYNKPLYNFKY